VKSGENRNSLLKTDLPLAENSSLGIPFLFCFKVPRRVIFLSNNCLARGKEVKKLSVVTLNQRDPFDFFPTSVTCPFSSEFNDT
jgi:hypothetical protein